MPDLAGTIWGLFEMMARNYVVAPAPSVCE